MALGTEFARNLCAGIGTKQLSIVLVTSQFMSHTSEHVPVRCAKVPGRNWPARNRPAAGGHLSYLPLYY